MTGLRSGRLLALDTSAEPIRLTPRDELAARLNGRDVVQLRHGRLEPRHAHDIHANRPDTAPLLRHDCRRWPTYTTPPDPTLLAPTDQQPACRCTQEEPCF